MNHSMMHVRPPAYFPMPNDDSKYDDLQRRCPRLGGQVPFSYCRNGASPREPCPKAFDCWWERFDVVAFFKQRLSLEAFSKLQNSPPPDKVMHLVDLVRQAKKRVNN